MAFCELCLNDKILVKSHIIPKAIHKLIGAKDKAILIGDKLSCEKRSREGIYDNIRFCRK